MTQEVPRDDHPYQLRRAKTGVHHQPDSVRPQAQELVPETQVRFAIQSVPANTVEQHDGVNNDVNEAQDRTNHSEPICSSIKSVL